MARRMPMASSWSSKSSDSIATERLRSYLQVDEHLLWAGRPKSGMVIQTADVGHILIGLLILAFALFWESGVLSIRGGPPPIVAIFGLFFVAMGLYQAGGFIFYDAFRRSRTYYGLTN